MAIYREKKFTSPQKVGGPEIWAAHRSQKVGGLRVGVDLTNKFHRKSWEG